MVSKTGSISTAISLPLITTLARAGALARAEALFAESGFADAVDDSAALSVKGRLLKDRALRASGADRVQLFKDAAAAYAAADAIGPAPYLLINVATLTALAGDARRAADVANVVLERIAAGNIAETPYWLAATRAEALLLKGNVREAQTALADAITHDPDGWSDHASTLRQLGLILDAQALAKGWLDPFRPPQSLHFAGHLGVVAESASNLRAEIDALLEVERIGFGYGALAAGADLVVAEAVLAHGATLHVILPTSIAVFVNQSITPYGGNWHARFEACLDQADSVVEATRVGGRYEPLATTLAADIAMGAALLNARTLESSASQLLVIDEGAGRYGDGSYTADIGKTWAQAGHPQFLLRAPRDQTVAPSAGKHEGRDDRRLAALLHLSFAGLDRLDDQSFADALDDAVLPFLKNLAALPDQPEHIERHGCARIYAFARPSEAALFALHVARLTVPTSFVLVIAGHFGLVHEIEGTLAGPGIEALVDLRHVAIPGGVTVSESFATALAITPSDHIRTEFFGVHPLANSDGETRLFALSEAQ